MYYIHLRTYFISSQLNSACGEKSSRFSFGLQQSTIFFSIPSSELVPTVSFIGIGPKIQILEQNIKSLYIPMFLLKYETGSSYNFTWWFSWNCSINSRFCNIWGFSHHWQWITRWSFLLKPQRLGTWWKSNTIKKTLPDLNTYHLEIEYFKSHSTATLQAGALQMVQENDKR